jgi:hypothetical protein
MTSAITPNTISTTFPVAGQDNDSQGFRDNFAEIVANFSHAESEITALQTNSVDVTKSVNNLLGSTLSNGLFTQLSATLNVANGVSGAYSIDLSIGAAQKFILNGDATLTFTNWPQYNGVTIYSTAIIIIEATGSGSFSYTPTFAATSGGQIYKATGFPSPLTISSTSATHLIEAISVDHQNVFLRYLGAFTHAL